MTKIFKDIRKLLSERTESEKEDEFHKADDLEALKVIDDTIYKACDEMTHVDLMMRQEVEKLIYKMNLKYQNKDIQLFEVTKGDGSGFHEMVTLKKVKQISADMDDFRSYLKYSSEDGFHPLWELRISFEAESVTKETDFDEDADEIQDLHGEYIYDFRGLVNGKLKIRIL